MKFIYLLMISIILAGCAQTPEIIKDDEQYAIVQYNNLGGNKVIIFNFDEVQFYNIYRYLEQDSTYALIQRVKRPFLPKQGNLGPYAIEWVDYKFTGRTLYKIEGLKDSGEKWFDVDIRYMNAK